jgi:hypothetical protein
MGAEAELKGSRETVLEFDVQPDGVCVLIRKTKSSPFPEYDYFLDSLEIAVDFCITDLGIPADIVNRYIPR